MSKKIAIIGASIAQLPLTLKAKEMGLEVYSFSWPQGAVCKDYVDHFIPISILEKDTIVEYCKKENIDGVVSNCSELAAQIVSYVAEKLGKVCIPYANILVIQDKSKVRTWTNTIDGLSPIAYAIDSPKNLLDSFQRPFVMKPINGSAKKGVNFVDSSTLDISMDDELKSEIFIAEQYIAGKEYSVETLSYKGQHDVIQITEKINTGAPHFVELEHHQPAQLSITAEDKIRALIPQILSRVGYMNGAAHTEIKVDSNENVYLIEVNPRGGGDDISNKLVTLSTDCDYLKQLISIALDEYQSVPVHNVAYAGIYYLSAYTKRLLPYFDGLQTDWMIERERIGTHLTYSVSNGDRDGFLIYRSKEKIIL